MLTFEPRRIYAVGVQVSETSRGCALQNSKGKHLHRPVARSCGGYGYGNVWLTFPAAGSITD